MIRSILFDWGGVLIDDPSKGFIDYCSSSLGVPSKTLEAAFHKFEVDFQTDQMNEAEMWRRVCNNLSINQPKSKSLWTDAVNKVFKDKKEIYDLVEILKMNGYKIGILSNTEIPTVNYFITNNYIRFFDVTVFSCFEKCVKPQEKIYRIALERLESSPDETIFIDDKPKYVEAAKKLGLVGILFENVVQLKNDLSALNIKVN